MVNKILSQLLGRNLPAKAGNLCHYISFIFQLQLLKETFHD